MNTNILKSNKPNNLKKLFIDETNRPIHFSKNISQNGPGLVSDFNSLYFDFSRCLLSQSELSDILSEMKKKVSPKVESMFKGDKINFTENREVLHTLLRQKDRSGKHLKQKDANENPKLKSVFETWRSMEHFSKKIHNSEYMSYNYEKPFRNILCVGIGGSYLGTEFVYQSLKAFCHPKINLYFVSNIDPLDFIENTQNLNVDETLVIIISKTFTTRETIINAKSIKEWLLTNYFKLLGKDKGKNGNGNGMVDTEKIENDIISRHMIAVSSNSEKVKEFGIETCFDMWEWVGGRYSVWSAVGLLPLFIAFGSDIVNKFVDGGSEADKHFRYEKIEDNIPYILGAISVYNTLKLKYNTRAVLPYSQALRRFPAHIQQLEMESNGKYVNSKGEKVDISGEVIIGEPGTNGQHSFYQLLHQGTTIVPCEFIGFCRQKYNYKLDDNILTNHDELMCNLFAQADALAFGKSKDELIRENCAPELIPHKIFEGNRPSVTLLFKKLDPWAIGYLLAIYEHRVAVQGFYLDINSFDQWGVELGKVLATQIRNKMEGQTVILNKSTSNMLDFYQNSK